MRGDCCACTAWLVARRITPPRGLAPGAARIQTRISCHSFRATDITTYLQNGGKLEVAQQMTGHESARTTGLYDRRSDTVALDEVERVVY